MVSDRRRREAAYRASVAAALAYIRDDEDADLYNLLDEAAKEDALGASYRLTFLAAKSVEELSAVTGETPSEVLDRLIRETHR